MKKTVLLFVLSFFSLLASSQTKKIITGTVSNNDQEKLAGVSIGVVGQSRSGTTDERGRFSIEVNNPSNAKLRFSFVGYKTQEVALKDSLVLNIHLQPDDNTMDELVVVAFGSQKKATMVGSVTSISAKELKGPTSNLTTTLAGRMPGIIAYQRSGEPGQDNANFFIRGVGTFGAGKQDPLIYIDGIESTPTDLARLQPDNIESFSLLKDASAAALYGARGANGVILVKTKIGVSGETRLNVRVENRLSTNTKNYKLADNITYMRLANEAVTTRDPLGVAPYSPNKIDNTLAGMDPILYPNNDWMKLLIKNYTNNISTNLDLSGGNEKAKFYVGLTYDENNGLLNVAKMNNFNSNVKLRTYSILSNISIKLTKSTDALISVRGLFDGNNTPVGGGASIFTAVSTSNPVAFPALYPQSYLPHAKHPLFGSAFVSNAGRTLYTNPFAQSVSGYQESDRSVLTPQITINQDLNGLTKGLTARVMGYTTRDASFDVTRRYSPFYYTSFTRDGVTDLVLLNTNIPGIGQIGDPPTEYLTYERGENKVSTVIFGEAIVNYLRLFNDKHSVGGQLISTIRSQLSGNANTLQLSLPKRNISLSGRATYGYDNRYLMEFNFGYNGSERFSAGKRYGFFPSLGAGWVVSNEKFFEPLTKVISSLKLRATFGMVGNDAIGKDEDRFFYLSEVNLNNNENGYVFGENYGYSRPGVSTSRYGNSEISWEKSKQTNLGLDLTLLKDINITVDAYRQIRSSILLIRSNIPNTFGLQAAAQANIGKAQSQGVDFALNYNKTFNKDFWIQARSTMTYATNKVLFNEEPNYAPGLSYLSKVGNPTGQLYGLIAERLFTDDTEVRNSPVQSFGEYRGGDIKYRDINGDGIISNLDVVPIGLPSNPEIIYGFGGSFGIKQFDFSFFFQGSARSSFLINPGSGRDNGNVQGIAPFVTNGGSQSGLLDVIAKDHWSEDNRNSYAFWPRLSSNVLNNNVQPSTWWLRSGDFLRLKQIDIGYNFSDKLAKKLQLSNVRIYVSALNIFTLSDFKLWDVEMAGNGLGYPIQKVYNIGLRVSL
ncbi:TonB-dependent receptor [Pedobacter gandavensis]|uniref:SusC/RagA family TonB-linked outer membrane protein n=1 Tax=Pedobacter gandavensis TaxID=2679963 RepID=UPI00292E3045|nr:TonB-dependent receptor [Pedobacter gandavensis]